MVYAAAASKATTGPAIVVVLFLVALVVMGVLLVRLFKPAGSKQPPALSAQPPPLGAYGLTAEEGLHGSEEVTPDTYHPSSFPDAVNAVQKTQGAAVPEEDVTIVQLSDTKGTNFTIKPPVQYEDVMKEFEAAWAEKRLMRIWMEREGYTYRVNPQQVAFVQQLRMPVI